ncbi:MAG: winged helix-turn-helix domain-containing protein [Clostridia bacterium]|nr:winged helix-turn-helix domain-containing protein [Clostridia bacterium]
MIAILTTDPILARMLDLELQRGGFSATAPEDASLWLLDLDHPPRPFPPTTDAYVVGFRHEGSGSARADLVLPLPYPSAELQRILKCYAVKTADTVELRHLPGAALVSGKKVHLSPTEERIFEALLAKRGQTVSENELAATLGESAAASNVLQVHIYRLRRKLFANGASLIRAERGVGYRMI